MPANADLQKAGVEHAEEWLKHLRSEEPLMRHTAADNLERVIRAMLAFADTPPPAAAGDRALAIDRALVVAMEDFLDGPRRGGPYPEPMDTRDYRHEAYRVWTPLCRAILNALRTPEPDSGGEASDA